MDLLAWFFTNIGMAFYDLLYAVTHPGSWLAWTTGFETPEQKESLLRFIYYGGSTEFFFVLFILTAGLIAAAMVFRPFLWGTVRGLEAFANTVGRIAAWAGLLMVLQQIIVVFIQRIFAKAEISFGVGSAMTFDVSWWAEGLKLHNAIIVCLCCAYTFVQGGHVRVDLVYAGVKFRTKKIIDMVGSVVLMAPLALLIWKYAWYFLWRNMINPPVSASDTLDRMLLKAKAARWSVETIGFSPNGFNAYFLFKILMVLFAAMVFIQAVAFFLRSYGEWREGPEAENRYLDKDRLGEEDFEADTHDHLQEGL